MSFPVFSYTVIDAMQLRLCMLNATAPYPLGMGIMDLKFSFSRPQARTLEQLIFVKSLYSL
jgi:hypothetical protein